MPNTSGLSFNVEILGHAKIDFDSRSFRKGLMQCARLVQKDSKILLSRRAISNPGEYPGLQTGDTKKSIIAKSSKSGWTAMVQPKRTEQMAKHKFYPQILTKGRKASGGRKGKRPSTLLEPRADPVADSLDARRVEIQDLLFIALQKALEARG